MAVEPVGPPSLELLELLELLLGLAVPSLPFVVPGPVPVVPGCVEIVALMVEEESEGSPVTVVG